MHVVVEKKEGIQCDLAIEVPAEEIDQEVDKRLKEISKKARIDGFRPGKVPVRFIKQRYGEGVRAEVIGDILPRTSYEAIEAEKLKAAGIMDVKVIQDKEGESLKFVAQVELYPEFEVTGIENIEVEKPVVQLGEKEVDQMIETLRKQTAKWNEVERQAKMDDQVKIDYIGTVDDEAFEGGSAEDQELVLGSKQMIPGFEEGIVGMTSGEEKAIDVTFPEGYHNKELASKQAQFKITLKSVQEPELPELNEDFFKRFNIEGDYDAFRKEIENNMKRELKAAVKKKVKEQVFDGLKEQNEIEIPTSLVQNEVYKSKQELVERFGGNKSGIKVDDIPDEMFKKPCEDRVKLGLLVGRLFDEYKFEADQEKVDQMIDEIVSVYEDSETVKSHILKNKQELENIKQAVIEDQLVEKILESAKVTEKDADFFELVRSVMNQQTV
ncbi:trigger factor [Thiotrichales bacterium 19S9-12]|nr:trigger factor [Thiotrichales bacterium 19S9-11]MCF6812071.1 trigger factor [Thiotrichales bacterium 19S9-12]